jgi:hypothetical protein
MMQNRPSAKKKLYVGHFRLKDMLQPMPYLYMVMLKKKRQPQILSSHAQI